MTPETYYTVRRIESPCKSQSAVVFDLTYRRVGTLVTTHLSNSAQTDGQRRRKV
jgi:hypothetical protein